MFCMISAATVGSTGVDNIHRRDNFSGQSEEELELELRHYLKQVLFYQSQSIENKLNSS